MVKLDKVFPVRDQLPVRRALISVSDKEGLADFGRALADIGVELISTGGTRQALIDAGLEAIEVATITGFPEMLDGRVKTLHPAIHGGILAVRGDAGHDEAMERQQIGPIDLVVVNLYPFETTAGSEATEAEIVENIDIGGPALIRAAAKNHAGVAVIVDPEDYTAIVEELRSSGGSTGLPTRRRLAAKAFARTAAYDAAIANWFAATIEEAAPKWRSFSGALRETLRYGENPHQTAGFYAGGEPRPGVATARQIQGKPLSYNNIADTDAAFELVAEFDPAESAAVAIIKHANPCGVGVAGTLGEAYAKALLSDPVSAFGGIVALNRSLDAKTAAEIVKIFTEVVIAPDADDDALEVMATKKNLRLLIAGAVPDPNQAGLTVRSVAGGFLVQDRDAGRTGPQQMATPSKRAPSEAEIADLFFAFRVCKHVKSNAIVLAKDGATVGIGAGQMSRLDSAITAVRKAEEVGRETGLGHSAAKGAVVASDAFFPFPDALLVAADAGATAVIHPGGSMRDEEVTAAADERGMAMIHTGMRHFRH